MNPPDWIRWIEIPALRWIFLSLLTASILCADYFTGLATLLPAWLMVPVAIAAWYDPRWASAVFAIALPIVRLALRYTLQVPIDVSLQMYFHCAFQAWGLLVLALLISRVSSLTQDVRILRGLLPICMYCHRIRTPAQEWEKLEAYLTKHSDATFTHMICTSCQTKRTVL